MTKEEMILYWDRCRGENPGEEEFFTAAEREAMEELLDAKDVLPPRLLQLSGLDGVDSPAQLENDRALFMTAVETVAADSLPGMGAARTEKGVLVFGFGVMNVWLFRSTLMIYLTALLRKEASGEPFGLLLRFPDADSEYMFTYRIQEVLPALFPELVKVVSLSEKDPACEQAGAYALSRRDDQTGEETAVCYKMDADVEMLNRKLCRGGDVLFQTYDPVHRLWQQAADAMACFLDTDNTRFLTEEQALEYLDAQDRDFTEMGVYSESADRLPAPEERCTALLEDAAALQDMAYTEDNGPDLELAARLAGYCTEDSDFFYTLPVCGVLMDAEQGAETAGKYCPFFREDESDGTMNLVILCGQNPVYPFEDMPLYKILWYLRSGTADGLLFFYDEERATYLSGETLFDCFDALNLLGPESEDLLASSP